MPPRYVITDGTWVGCFWLYGPYWTADISKTPQFISEAEAKFVARLWGVKDYTIQPVPTEQAKQAS